MTWKWWRSKDEKESDRREVERVVDRVHKMREEIDRVLDRAERDIERGVQRG